MYFQTLNDCLTTRFVYDSADVVMELNANNEVIWAWVNAPGLDQPIERIAFINGTPRQRQVFHADGLGSIAALTDESGATVQTYAYAAFGGIGTQTGTDLNRVTFTAREAMGDTLGFFYYRHRIYDPTTGRFTSEDPLGFIDGPNRYVYCANNPISIIDPYGLEGKSWFPRDLSGIGKVNNKTDKSFFCSASSGQHGDLTPSLMPPGTWGGGRFKIAWRP